jgi:precorrin-2 dehydrogenase / sirohydrochlorin ferrochelatase
MHLFPLFLKLEGRHCVIVGAGPIAEGKIEGLLDTGAHLRVVAPEATEKIREWDRSAKLEWHQRPFQPCDLDGMFLVVASTNSTPLHEQIFAEAHRRNVLCNIVDVPHLCDFYYPAVVRRGPLQIAISTSGESPALAQRLRKDLESQFGPEYEQWLAHLRQARETLQADKSLDPESRKRELHDLVTKESLAAFLQASKFPKVGNTG